MGEMGALSTPGNSGVSEDMADDEVDATMCLGEL